MRFWDSSALVKLYVREPDSAEFKKLAADPELPLISSFTIHELHCALWRKEFASALTNGAAEVLFEKFLHQIDSDKFKLVAYSAKVKDRATEVIRICYRKSMPIALRSLDALQIASALDGGASDMVSADLRMRDAGKLFGLRLFPS